MEVLNSSGRHKAACVLLDLESFSDLCKNASNK